METIIESFYAAFNKCDSETMIRCYHDRIIFSDPAFGMLEGEHAKNMWRMLCKSQRGRDFRVDLKDVKIFDDRATADWEAFYNFSRTGRRVHNIVHAEFLFEDDRIAKHSDFFDLHNWAKQALGWKGLILGNTSFFRNQIQKQTSNMLSRFENS